MRTPEAIWKFVNTGRRIRIERVNASTGEVYVNGEVMPDVPDDMLIDWLCSNEYGGVDEFDEPKPWRAGDIIISDRSGVLVLGMPASA